jgi:hypothetical protein
MTADRQTSIRLPSALYARLVAAAGKGGVGEEIRDRLEASFSHDEKTEELCRYLVRLATVVEQDLAPWHSDPYACEAFVAGLAVLLRVLKPEGEPAARPGNLTEPGDDPKVIGRTLARLAVFQLGEEAARRNVEWSGRTKR